MASVPREPELEWESYRQFVDDVAQEVAAAKANEASRQRQEAAAAERQANRERAQQLRDLTK